MENHHDSNKPIVIKVKLNCCNKCPNKLRKAFLKIHGVQTVEVYQEMNLVLVIGKVDPHMLIDNIKRAGKEATLGCLDDLKQCNKKNIHSDDDHHLEESHEGVAAEKERWHQEEYYTAGGKDKCPQNGYFQQNKAKKCYCNGDPNYKKKARDGDDHVVEHFEGPRIEEFDEEICKDPYCRIHRRNHGGVTPVHDRPPMYWDHQVSGCLGRSGYIHGGRNPPGPPPPWFRKLSHSPPPPFGYPSSSMPPPPPPPPPPRPPYGYSSMHPPSYGGTRPPFGNDCYGDYEAN